MVEDGPRNSRCEALDYLFNYQGVLVGLEDLALKVVPQSRDSQGTMTSATGKSKQNRQGERIMVILWVHNHCNLREIKELSALNN